MVARFGDPMKNMQADDSVAERTFLSGAGVHHAIERVPAVSGERRGEPPGSCAIVDPPPNACPPGFIAHTYEESFRIGAPREAVWSWLERPATFVDGQIWPFRVEFVSSDPAVAPGFVVGGLNVHHGPLMSFAGQLTEIREGAYRSLHYFYGSYVLSLRLIRPTCLEFWVEDADAAATDVRLRVSSFVRRPIAGAWGRAQRVFWRRFPRWMGSALDAPLLD